MQHKRRRVSSERRMVTLFSTCLLLLVLWWFAVQATQQHNTMALSLNAPHEAQGHYAILFRTERPVIEAGSGQTQVTALVRDIEGNPANGITVQFDAQQGTFSQASVQTNAEGVATTLFSAAAQSGRVVLQATAGDSNAIAYVEVKSQAATPVAPVLAIQVNTTTLKTGQTLQVTALLKDTNGLAIANVPVTLFGSMGVIAVADLITDSEGKVTTQFTAGLVPGTATITALYGSISTRTQLQIVGEANPTATPGTNGFQVHLPLVTR